MLTMRAAEVPGTLNFANFLQALVTFARLRFPALSSVNAAASALCDNHVFLVNASSARASEASVDSLALPEVIDVLRAHRPQLGRLYSAFSLTPQQRVACTNVEQLPDASGALSLGSFLIMLHQLAVVPALLARKAAVRAFMASCMFPPPAGIDEMSEARVRAALRRVGACVLTYARASRRCALPSSASRPCAWRSSSAAAARSRACTRTRRRRSPR